MYRIIQDYNGMHVFKVLLVSFWNPQGCSRKIARLVPTLSLARRRKVGLYEMKVISDKTGGFMAWEPRDGGPQPQSHQAHPELS